MVLLPLPALAGSLAVVPENYFILWGQPYFLTAAANLAVVANFVVLIGVFLIAAPSFTPSVRVRLSPNQQLKLKRLTRVIATITFAAYVAWLLAGIARGLSPSLLVQAAVGQGDAIYSLKSTVLAPISGVTTWTQLGVLLGPLLVLQWRIEKKFPVKAMACLLIAVVARAFFFSERLAFIEVACSTFLMWALLRDRPLSVVKTFGRWLGVWAGALAALILIFAAFEYSRSWLTYYAANFEGSLWEFAAQRLLGYYATALNNGALKVSVVDGQGSFFSLFEAPAVPFRGESAGGTASEPDAFRYEFLTGSNPEFTNVSALLDVNALVGNGGALIFWFSFALSICLIAKSASSGNLMGLVAYSCLGVGVLEIVRIFYFGTTRFLPIIIGLVCIAAYLGKTGQNALTHAPRHSCARQRPGS